MKKYLPVAGTFCLSRTHKATIPYKYKRQTESRSKRNRPNEIDHYTFPPRINPEKQLR